MAGEQSGTFRDSERTIFYTVLCLRMITRKFLVLQPQTETYLLYDHRLLDPTTDRDPLRMSYGGIVLSPYLRFTLVRWTVENEVLKAVKVN